MKHPELKEFSLNSESDAAGYIRWLKEHKLDYHFDDVPGDIIWFTDIDDEDLVELERLHVELWHWDPWEIFEACPGLFDFYCGPEPENDQNS